VILPSEKVLFKELRIVLYVLLGWIAKSMRPGVVQSKHDTPLRIKLSREVGSELP
jgi:hypothetical protein